MGRITIMANGKQQASWLFTEDDKALVVKNARELMGKMYMADFKDIELVEERASRKADGSLSYKPVKGKAE